MNDISSHQTLNLDTYSIVIGDIIESLKQYLEPREYSQILVIVDPNTDLHCFPKIAPLLSNYTTKKISIPSGEIHKTIQTCQSIWHQIMDSEADRKALVINLGGGVIGDMGGFCASTYKRGIEFIQIPTTLLAQVDASIGGKLGIDFNQIKNSIGLFNNPGAVLIWPGFLATLPPRELRSGFAEVIKHALIQDASQWEKLQAIEDLSSVDWVEYLVPSLQIKQRIVEEDPFEKGIRKALNFGHTIGHAIESVFLETDTPLLHGEAIAIGMICEAYLSTQLTGLPQNQLAIITQYINRIFATVQLDAAQYETFIKLMKNDKKNRGKEINFTLLTKIGACQINQSCAEEMIVKSFDYYGQQLVAIS